MSTKVYKSTTDITHTKLLDDNSQSSSQESISERNVFAQCMLTGAVMLSAASCGMPIGYSAILLPQLKATNGSLQIDDDIGSWIASVHSAATPVGALLSGFLMEQFGRKSALQLSALPLVIGWLLIGLAHNHALILTGRFIAGMSSGLCAAPGQVLIGETTEPHLRGILSSSPLASYSFGILLVYALGSLLDWRFVAGLSTLLPLIATTIFFFLPESPVWLVQQGRDEDAKNALIWLRGGDTIQAKQELQEMVSRLESDVETKANRTSCWSLLLDARCLKPFVIVNVFNVMQVLSGTYLVVFYAVDILASIGGNHHVDAFFAAVLTAGVRFIFTIAASFLLTSLGRRSIALSSGVGTALAAITVAMAVFQSAQHLLVALGIFLYVAFNTIGFLVLPGVLISEMFPVRARGIAGGLTFAIFNFLLFSAAKCFPVVRSVVGIEGIFCLFGISSVLAVCFLYFMLPETKGKSLAQIEDYFQGSEWLWSNKNANGRDAKCDIRNVKV